MANTAFDPEKMANLCEKRIRPAYAPMNFIQIAYNVKNNAQVSLVPLEYASAREKQLGKNGKEIILSSQGLFPDVSLPSRKVVQEKCIEICAESTACHENDIVDACLHRVSFLFLDAIQGDTHKESDTDDFAAFLRKMFRIVARRDSMDDGDLCRIITECGNFDENALGEYAAVAAGLAILSPVSFIKILLLNNSEAKRKNAFIRMLKSHATRPEPFPSSPKYPFSAEEQASDDDGPLEAMERKETRDSINKILHESLKTELDWRAAIFIAIRQVDDSFVSELYKKMLSLTWVEKMREEIFPPEWHYIKSRKEIFESSSNDEYQSKMNAFFEPLKQDTSYTIEQIGKESPQLESLMREWLEFAKSRERSELGGIEEFANVCSVLREIFPGRSAERKIFRKNYMHMDIAASLMGLSKGGESGRKFEIQSRMELVEKIQGSKREMDKYVDALTHHNDIQRMRKRIDEFKNQNRGIV